MKKMLPWLITILLAISLIFIVGVFVWNSMFSNSDETTAGKEETKKVKTLTADQLVEMTSQIQDVKRNLKDDNKYVIISFAFQLDKAKTKEEFDKIKDITIKPIINRTLADMTSAELNGSAGQDALESKLLTQINSALPDGKLLRVDITAFTLTDM